MLVVLTLLVGVIQLALGVLKLGWITKFVSNAVMVGFIIGVCILIILGQLGDLTGYSSEYSNKVAKTVDLLFHFGEIDWPTLAVGLATIALILLLNLTVVRKFSMVVAFAAACAPSYGRERSAHCWRGSRSPRAAGPTPCAATPRRRSGGPE